MSHPSRWIGSVFAVLLCAATLTSAGGGHYHGGCGIHVGGFYATPYFGFYGGYYPGFYGYGWGYPYAAPYYYGGYGAYSPPDVGFVDTDVSPEKAEVLVDGEYAGTADDFDGFPNYLTLEPGHHTIVFRLAGYRTVTRELRVTRGAYVDLTFSLSKGEGEEPGPAPHASLEVAPPPQQQPEPPVEDSETEAEPGFAKLSVTPADASVYLDHEYLGTAGMLTGLHGDLRLAPGGHLVQIVRPGYVSQEKKFTLASGEHRRLTLNLVAETDD